MYIYKGISFFLNLFIYCSLTGIYSELSGLIRRSGRKERSVQIVYEEFHAHQLIRRLADRAFIPLC